MKNRAKISEIEAEARRIASKRNWVVVIAEICVIFIFPVIISILIQNMNELNSRGIFWVLILLAGSAQLLLGLVILLPAKNEFFYFDHLDLKKEFEGLETKYRRAEYTGRVVYHMLENVHRFIKECASSRDAFPMAKIMSSFDAMMQTPVTFREGVLGFSLRDRYSFVVYLYSAQEDLLKPFYNATDIRITSAKKEWRPYKGSIGTCFAEKRIIFNNDLAESAEWDVYYTPEERRNYRSLVATPIYNLGDDSQTVRGVLAVTSSLPTRFEEHIYKPIFTSLATIIAIFFWAADDKLPEGTDYI